MIWPSKVATKIVLFKAGSKVRFLGCVGLTAALLLCLRSIIACIQDEALHGIMHT